MISSSSQASSSSIRAGGGSSSHKYHHHHHHHYQYHYQPHQRKSHSPSLVTFAASAKKSSTASERVERIADEAAAGEVADASTANTNCGGPSSRFNTLIGYLTNRRFRKNVSESIINAVKNLRSNSSDQGRLFFIENTDPKIQ